MISFSTALISSRHVTSGTMLPGTKTGIGMGYVPTACAHPDARIYVAIRNKHVPARVVK